MDKTPEELVADIQEACKLLGWHIAMNESSNTVNGIIIGQLPYVEGIIDQLVEVEEYSIYANVANTETGLH